MLGSVLIEKKGQLWLYSKFVFLQSHFQRPYKAFDITKIPKMILSMAFQSIQMLL